MTDSDDLTFEHIGLLGLITLNRPKALNALTHAMVRGIDRTLDAWTGDDAVQVVGIRGAGDRAFCAGGDIRALYDAGRIDGRRNWRFYADEYRMNVKIKRFPKPFVAIMDGIVMGGGVGVSIHGRRRIATERTVFAMPETGIGLFPDVGGTWFLPRLPGQTGMWLGLTGSRLKGAETVAAGVCDLMVPSTRMDALIDDLDHNRVPPRETDRPVLEKAEVIDRCFGGTSVEEILEKLAADPDPWAQKQRDAILTKSPLCTRLTFRQIRTGAALSFEDCMRLEYRLARFCMMRPDFYEGVRAVIIDKDNAPRWSPETLADVSDALVDRAFAPLGDEELVF